MNSMIAYLDPGSGSLILQMLVGGFSGIVVLGRYLWMQYVARKPIQMQSSAEIPVCR